MSTVTKYNILQSQSFKLDETVQTMHRFINMDNDTMQLYFYNGYLPLTTGKAGEVYGLCIIGSDTKKATLHIMIHWIVRKIFT